jgi:RNA polymerase sigma-70 factor, ECF subfamily
VSLPAASFHEVYQAHSREVYRFALYLSGDRARAEDLTAEAFLKIWVSPAPTHLKTIKSYLLTIVRNLHVQSWRKQSRETPLRETSLMDVPSHRDNLERTLDQKAELNRVLAALQQLDTVERSAVLLRGEHHMSYEEIAHMLELPPVTIRVKVHRARQKLMQARKGIITP